MRVLFCFLFLFFCFCFLFFLNALLTDLVVLESLAKNKWFFFLQKASQFKKKWAATLKCNKYFVLFCKPYPTKMLLIFILIMLIQNGKKYKHLESFLPYLKEIWKYRETCRTLVSFRCIYDDSSGSTVANLSCLFLSLALFCKYFIHRLFMAT